MSSRKGSGDKSLRRSLLSSSTSTSSRHDQKQNDNSNTFNYVNFPMPSSSSISGNSINSATTFANDEFLQSYYNMDQRNLVSDDKDSRSVSSSKTSSSSSTLSRTSSLSIAARYRGGQKILSTTSDLMFRTTSSTKKAMRELAQRRYEAKQKKKAVSLFVSLVLIASSILYVAKFNYNLGVDMQNGTVSSINVAGNIMDVNVTTVDDGVVVSTNSTNAEGLNQTSIGSSSSSSSSSSSDITTGSSNMETSMKENKEDDEPPPEEEVIEEGNEFLQPLKYFADLTTQSRKSDSNFFFHIPRSGGQTIKDIVGKCLRMTLASEVGVRDGHADDTVLQVIEYNEAKYVNVDTTSIEGLHKAASLNLASSSLSDMITSSYFGEVGMLFDLHHKGRAFVLLRDPTVRAVSMYHYKTQGDNPSIDPSVSIEDYAQGNGIENNWVTRFLTGRMEGELMKEDLEHAKVIMEKKFLIGFLDDGEETVYRLMKYFGFSFSEDETVKMEQEDCIKDLLKGGTNHNSVTYEVPKRGSQAAALIKWQTQFDIKLFDYARDLFDAQTKLYGSKERKKELRKKKKEGH